MNFPHQFLLLVLPILSILFAILFPSFSLSSINPFKSSSSWAPLDPDLCRSIPELSRCSSSWIDDQNPDLAYLTCSSPDSAATLKLYSFTSQKTSILELIGSTNPLKLENLQFEVVAGYSHSDNDTISLFVLSKPSSDSAEREEDSVSVVEIFETKRSRQMHVEWVGTLQDELLGRKTTKSLVGMGKKSFYFIANEENVKRSYWTKGFEWLLNPKTSNIVHCDGTSSLDGDGKAQCRIALEGISSSSSIASHPSSSTLYLSSDSSIKPYEIQSDHTLFPLPQTISLNHPISHIHLSSISPLKLYALTTLNPLLKIFSSSKNRQRVQVQQVTETDGEDKYYGHQFSVHPVLTIDASNKVLKHPIDSMTSYRNELLLTSLDESNQPMVCQMIQEARLLTREEMEMMMEERPCFEDHRVEDEWIEEELSGA